MKKSSTMFTCAILLATCALTYSYSQTRSTSVTGIWKGVDGGRGFQNQTYVLTANGSVVTGTVQDVPISDGRVDGNTFTFKMTSGDGRRSATMTGKINGDEILFTREVVAPEGDAPPNRFGFTGLGPTQFTVRRVPDGLAAITDSYKAPPVTFDRILHAEQEPQNWLTYSGTLLGHRHSLLKQITTSNVKDLEIAWVWQARSRATFEATSLVVDGVLYTVQAPNDVIALDAATGRVLWTYAHTPLPGARASGGGGRPNRGLAVLGSTLFLGTLDAHLLAIDAYTGKLLWNTTVADAADPACKGGLCYVITHAPLVVKDKVIVGVGGSEGQTRCFVAAFDAATGKEDWRFSTVPAAGEPGIETWSGESWKTGGAGVWATGVYDPDLNLTYWGTGNPWPVWDGSTRLGDNLYSNSVVALDADTGKLKWYYQFTPHDEMDWDSAQTPALVDLQWEGRLRKVMIWANRNGLFYVLDRATGQFLLGKPFVEVNWMSGFDEKGRPVRAPGKGRSDKTLLLPGIAATNWYPPSYSPNTGLLYLAAWERGFIGGAAQLGTSAYGAIRAIDPRTGDKKWEFRRNDAVFTSGVLTTASDLVFTGVWGDFYSESAAARRADRYFYALDARTGERLWQMALSGSVEGSPMSYSVDGTQYVAVAAGNTLFAFSLRE